MDFNFYEQYKGSSTVDLLIIVKQPDKYQPEAVNAAKMILRERNVSEAEEQQALEIIMSRQRSKIKKRDEDKTLSELLDPLTDPDADKSVDKTIYIGLTVVSVFYSWIAYSTAKIIILSYLAEMLDGYVLIEFLNLSYLVCMLYMLWKRQAWGWRLLFGHVFLSVTNMFYGMFLNGSGYIDAVDVSDLYILLLPLGARIFVLWYMWKDKIASHFSIYDAEKKRTLKVMLIIFAVIILGSIIIGSDVKIIS
jgi:hypothetical protein